MKRPKLLSLKEAKPSIGIEVTWGHYLERLEAKEDIRKGGS